MKSILQDSPSKTVYSMASCTSSFHISRSITSQHSHTGYSLPQCSFHTNHLGSILAFRWNKLSHNLTHSLSVYLRGWLIQAETGWAHSHVVANWGWLCSMCASHRPPGTSSIAQSPSYGDGRGQEYKLKCARFLEA